MYPNFKNQDPRNRANNPGKWGLNALHSLDTELRPLAKSWWFSFFLGFNRNQQVLKEINKILSSLEGLDIRHLSAEPQPSAAAGVESTRMQADAIPRNPEDVLRFRFLLRAFCRTSSRALIGLAQGLGFRALRFSHALSAART